MEYLFIKFIFPIHPLFTNLMRKKMTDQRESLMVTTFNDS